MVRGENQDKLMESAVQSVSKFAKFIKLTGENTEELIKLTQIVKQISNNSANRIKIAVENFRKKLNSNSYEHHGLQKCMDSLSKSFLKLSSFNLRFSFMLQNEFVEPVKMFFKESHKGNVHLYKKLAALVADVEKKRKKMELEKKNYYQFCTNAEKSQKRLESIMKKYGSNNFSKKELERETEKSTSLKMYAEESRYSYEESVNELNKSWHNFSEKFLPFYETFDLKELNRVDLIRRKGAELGVSINKFFKKGLKMPDLHRVFEKYDENPTPIKDRIFMSSEDLEKYRIPVIEETISYDRYKIEEDQNRISKSFHLADLDEASNQELQDMKMLVTIVFSEMMDRFSTVKRRPYNRSSTTSTMEESEEEDSSLLLNNNKLNVRKLDKLFSKSCLRDYFLVKAQKKIPPKTHMKCISNDCLQKLETVIHSIITNMLQSVERNPNKFLMLLEVLNAFYAKGNEEKLYLFQSFSSSAVWNDLVMWKDCYKVIIKKKKEEYTGKVEVDKSQKKTGGFLNPWKIVEGLQTMIVKKSTVEDEKLMAKVRSEALELIKFYLSNLNLSLGYSTEIISLIAKEYDIEQNYVASLVYQLENNYHTRDLAKLTRKKKPFMIKIAKWNDLMPFRLALDFIEDPNELREILFVSKKWNEKFKKFVYKKIVRNPNGIKDDTRRVLWKLLLDVKNCPHEYLGVRSDSLQLTESLEDVIRMDIQRSFPNHEGFNFGALKRVLRSTALTFSDSASYCQGMNYLAGNFLLYFKEEELSYKLLCQLLDLRMMPIFTDDFVNLQMNFYMVDRLNNLFIPDLWEHFKDESLLPVFYCSGWFITLFTNTMQYTDYSYIILWVIDFYLAEGLKGFLKCVVVVMKHLKKRFLNLGFDQIMNYLSDLTKKELFTNLVYVKYKEDKDQNGLEEEELKKKYKEYWDDFVFLDKFRQKVNELPLSSPLIVHLENKYKVISKKLNKKL